MMLLTNGMRAVAVLGVALVAACTSRPPETLETRVSLPQEAIDPTTKASATPIIPRIDDDNKHTVLALSGGGSDGAYGAGLLKGWSESGTRPEFDVVTGVSTGALLSIFAFLGPEYDDMIGKLYISQTNHDIFKKRGAAALTSDSLYDNTPFKKQIETYVTHDLLEKVAAEHRKGRRLYIATTNLDGGVDNIWDMGKIALDDGAGRSDKLLHFQKIVRASASVPIAFPPVYIKPERGVQLKQMNVDGGVKKPILFEPFMTRSNQKEKEVYLVVNGSTAYYNAALPVEPKLASIGAKTVTELIRALTIEMLYRHYTTARDAGMKYYLTSIPPNVPLTSNALNFDPKQMKTLYDAGRRIGRRGKGAWRDTPRQEHHPNASVYDNKGNIIGGGTLAQNKEIYEGAVRY